MYLCVRFSVFLDSRLLTFWGGRQIYKPVHEDIDRLVLLGLPNITHRMLGGAELYYAYRNSDRQKTCLSRQRAMSGEPVSLDSSFKLL